MMAAVYQLHAVHSATHAVIIWRPLFCDGRPACVEQAAITLPTNAVC